MPKLSLISIPAPPAAVVDEFITSPKKQLASNEAGLKKAAAIWRRRQSARLHTTSFLLYLLIAFAFLSMLKSTILWHPRLLLRDPCDPLRIFRDQGSYQQRQQQQQQPQPQQQFMVIPLRPHDVSSNMSESEKQFWKQPDSLSYRPCLEFSDEYRNASASALGSGRKRFLMVVVNGGLNQQRNQVVDAVLIARILEATLVVPVLQVNQIWGDDSEFADLFDVEHFKRILRGDVKVVSSLPSTHVVARPHVETSIPMHATPEWIRQHYARKMRRDNVLLLRGIDSRLSSDLPLDLQRLRCKVAFHALRFAPRLQALGERLARRMWEQGPYVALHLRLEKDVWVRTGCLPGLGPEVDEEVKAARVLQPQLLTSRSRMTAEERRKEGMCPLRAAEVARVLRSLGASERTRVFWAGGRPLGGEKALEPLRREFPLLYDKFAVAHPRELEPYRGKASSLAAIDYIISLNADVFMPSHGGNMGHALRVGTVKRLGRIPVDSSAILQGHRAYVGHRKYITPKKKELIPIFANWTQWDEAASEQVRRLHVEADGRPLLRTERRNRDVLSYPAPECMCRGVFDLKLKRMVRAFIK